MTCGYPDPSSSATCILRTHRGLHTDGSKSWETEGERDTVVERVRPRRRTTKGSATDAILGFLGKVNAETHARESDPETSHAAARELSDQSSMMYRLLLAYSHSPSTAEEASLRAGFTQSDGAWKRCSDLKNIGLIQPTGLTRRASSNRDQMVCEITEAGSAGL